MSKQVVEDARAAYMAWKEAPVGSYVERTIADAIVRDIVPALLHVIERGPIAVGFERETELSSDTEVALSD